MTDSQIPDESSRLLPAIPHRSYVYADELVREQKNDKEITTNVNAVNFFVVLITESNTRAGNDE